MSDAERTYTHAEVEAQVAPLRDAQGQMWLMWSDEKRRADAAESALRQVRDDLTALADEHHAWMTARVPADDLDERNRHRGLVAGVRTVLARVGAADTQPEGAGEVRPHGPGCVDCDNGVTEFHRSRTDKPNPLTPTAGSNGETAPEADCYCPDDHASWCPNLTPADTAPEADDGYDDGLCECGRYGAHLIGCPADTAPESGEGR